jgi:hypothetical protein
VQLKKFSDSTRPRSSLARVLIFLKISFIFSSLRVGMKIAYFHPFVKDKMCNGVRLCLLWFFLARISRITLLV